MPTSNVLASSRIDLQHGEFAASAAGSLAVHFTSSATSSSPSINDNAHSERGCVGEDRYGRISTGSSGTHRRGSSSRPVDASRDLVLSDSEFVLGSSPDSLLELWGVFTHVISLQSWTSLLLAVCFHLFHLLIFFLFVSSPILYRSIIFSPQTMARELLEAQYMMERHGGGGVPSGRGAGELRTAAQTGYSGSQAAVALHPNVSQASIAVEGVWAIHDSLFFLERGHVVIPTSIRNSFSRLRRNKHYNGRSVEGGDKNATLTNTSESTGVAVNDISFQDTDRGVRYDGSKDTRDDDSKRMPDGGSHTYMVQHSADSDDAANRRSKYASDRVGGQRSVVSAVAVAMLREKAVTDTTGGSSPLRYTASGGSVINNESHLDAMAGGIRAPLSVLAPPPPVAPEGILSRRKRATRGRATLSNMIEAWEASSLYSSPVALALLYYLYLIGCLVLLLAVTGGALTGFFSVLRLCIVLAEILWYFHHGAHAFLLYCWMLLLSHGSQGASRPASDAVFLREGTPYALVARKTGQVSMFLFYRASSTVDESAGVGGGYGGAGKLLVSQLDLPYYLYTQLWYLRPLAQGIKIFYLCLLSLCLVRDLHRVLDAVIGVRELMEPEGCVRCPLCGKLLRAFEQRRFVRRKSLYQSARSGMVSSVRRTKWWWRWLRSAVRGSRGSHRVLTPRLPSPLWHWLLPSWCSGVAHKASPEVSRTTGALTPDCNVFPNVLSGDREPRALADIIEDVNFFNESAVRRSAAAPQETPMEEAAHLMRWLTVIPSTGRQSMAGVREDESRHHGATSGDFSYDEEGESSDATTLSSPSSSTEGVSSVGLVRVVPTVTSAKHSMGDAVARGQAAASESGKKRRSCPITTRLVASTSLSDTRTGQGRNRQHTRRPSRRRTRVTDEALYWNHATRHVHHRCPKLYLDAQEETDDEEDDRVLCSESMSAVSSSTATTSTADFSALPIAPKGGRCVPETLATTKSAHAHSEYQHATSERPRLYRMVSRRSLSPSSWPRGGDGEEGRLHRLQPFVESVASPQLLGRQHQPRKDGQRESFAKGALARSRNYGTIDPDISRTPSRLTADGAPLQLGVNRIAQRGLYDPVKDVEDEFRPGNAFQSYSQAGWISRLTFSWLNALLTFGLLEPTLLRQERFLPSLPVTLLSLENIAIPAWRLWVYRKVWFPDCVTKPGGLLIPSDEMVEHTGDLGSLADVLEVDTSDDTESSDGRQTIVMLSHTSLKKAAKLRPQRPYRCWQERLVWFLLSPVRRILVTLFYHVCIGTSRTVGRTRRRLVRELLKDRLAAAAKDLYDLRGDRSMEANEELEAAAGALGEVASSCGSSAAAPSAGSALPTHMRRQLVLGDVSLFDLFLEHSCGRRFLFIAAPLLLVSEVLTVSLVLMFERFIVSLQRVDTETLRHGTEARGVESDATTALLNAFLFGGLVLLQGIVQSAYVSQVQQAAMEARTCVRAMVLEKTLSLPLAQRTFTETEVVTLATDEAVRVATSLTSLHQTWSYPVRVTLLLLLLAHYVGWVAAAVVGVGPLFILPILRRASHKVRQRRHEAQEAAMPRIALLQRTFDNIRQVKAMLLEGFLVRQLHKARAAEASCAEAVAVAEGTAGMLAGGTVCLLMVVSLGAECLVFENELHRLEVLGPVLVTFLLLTMPLLELPALFTVVARGFLSMKRIEAYLRQAPDEFVGTWVDLESFAAMQQQLRLENPSSDMLKYRRGSVVCRDSSFTWQHNLTEESPTAFLRDVDICIEPGELAVVQGSIGAGKSTLLLCVLGEINRCVSTTCSTNSSVVTYESESTLSVVSGTDAAACITGADHTTRQGNSCNLGPVSTVDCSVTPNTLPNNSSGRVDATPPSIFVASPTNAHVADWNLAGEQSPSMGLKVGAGGMVQRSPIRIAGEATSAADAKSSCASGGEESRCHARGTSLNLPGNIATRESDNVRRTAGMTFATHSLAGMEGVDRSTGGFFVFGSCAYCSEVPWLLNDTIRANIVLSNSSVEVGRWYYMVLRACALEAEVAVLPQGDATVVGDRGELLSLSMRTRIAVARAVYSKSHVYLMDSVLSPLEPDVQEHIIREVFHKLLRKKTVLLVSNVGLRSLRPHRVFSVVDGGIVREDTHLYRIVSSLNARSDGDDEEALVHQRVRRRTRPTTNSDDAAALERGREKGSDSSGNSDAHQATFLPLPPLYAEEFEEAQKAAEVEGVVEAFRDDPTMAATTLLFDGDAEFGLCKPREQGDLVKCLDEVVSLGDLPLANSMTTAGVGKSMSTDTAPRQAYSSHMGPSSARHLPSSRRRLAWSPAAPGSAVMPEPARSSTVISPPLTPSQSPVSEPLQLHTDGADARCGMEESGTAATSPEGGRTPNAGAHCSGSSTCSHRQHVPDHCADRIQRERILRDRHRLSFFIFLRFMGGQVVWLLFTALIQQGTFLCTDVWLGVWPIIRAALAKRTAAMAEQSTKVDRSRWSEVQKQLSTSVMVTDGAFFGMVLTLCILGMLLTLLRSRMMYVGVYGTMHFIYNQIMRRVLHSPASYFDRRIVALLTRVLCDDGEVAEHRVLSTVETLLSCTSQVALVVLCNALVNPLFMLVVPAAVGIFCQIAQRHAMVLREVRRLEHTSESGMIDILREVYQGAPTVRSMALQDRLREEFCRALDTVNTASMVVYSAECWVELRLHVIVALSLGTAGMVNILFTFPYSRPSLTAVAVVACLRAGPGLMVMCRNLTAFMMTEWVSVQRLMNLWSVPQEQLCLVGEADLYTYSNTRRKEAGSSMAMDVACSVPCSMAERMSTASHTVQQATLNLPRDSHPEADAAPYSSPGELQSQRQQQRLPTPGSEDGRLDLRSSQTHSVSADDSSKSSSLASRICSETVAQNECFPSRSPLIELCNVSVRYRATLPYALRHVTLSVFPGERVAVVGSAGQGKKTLLNVLLRLVDIIEGDGVFVGGEDAARMPYPILRGWFGLLPQEPLLVHGSWRTNLLVGYRHAHHVLMGSVHMGADSTGVLVATSVCHQLQPDTQTLCATANATVATQLASVAGKHQPLLQQGAAVAAFAAVEAKKCYGSTEGGQSLVHVSGGELTQPQPPDRFCHPSLSQKQSPVSEDSRRQKSACGVVSTAGATAGWLHDDRIPSHHRRDEKPVSPQSASCPDNSGRHCCSCSGGSANYDEAVVHRSSRHVVDRPQPPMNDATLWEALRAVGLDAAAEFDGGLDAPLLGSDSTGPNLTHSQCRLLCLARAILNRPPILLLEDTVHSGAEAQTDRVIRCVLANELRESTVLVVARRMPTVLNLCTRVVAMQGGTLVPIAELKPTLVPPVQLSAAGTSGRGLSSGAAPPAGLGWDTEVLERLSYYLV